MPAPTFSHVPIPLPGGRVIQMTMCDRCHWRSYAADEAKLKAAEIGHLALSVCPDSGLADNLGYLVKFAA